MRELLPYITNQLDFTVDSLHYFMPEIYLGVLFLLVMVTDLLYWKRLPGLCRIIAVLGMLAVLAQDIVQLQIPQQKMHLLFGGMLVLGFAATRFKLIIDILTILLLFYFVWDRQLKAHRKGLTDLYSIVIASVLGLHLMTMATHLLSIFLSIEFVSLASYLMVGYKSENGVSAGAGLKYVLFGAAASAVMLYGISLLYGFTGSAEVLSVEFFNGLSGINALSAGLALALVLAGIGFKLSFVPMHFWVPDVYEGAATPVTAYLSTLPKIAGFALLINFLRPFIYYHWQGFDMMLLLSVLGVVTMIAGNFAAVMQRNVKRMLAYSSIGHTGFALMAIVTFKQEEVTGLVYYLLVYGVANIGALMLASYFHNITGANQTEDYKGLGFKLPAASVCFVIVLISLTGLPGTAGFIGKLLLFKSTYSAWQLQHNPWLLALMGTGALTTVVALFYYIKIPLNLFVRKTEDNHEYQIMNQSLLIVAILISVFLVFAGLFPDLITKYL
ncbi:NADH dehydrogenase subunit N [Mucilaginibacter yixingensis]|uniref:NADH-quinone oxidoreductase subunit N n=1 Tax=Mucilaginibacter yixingensis TaxID=1295612 RepID=A0A2T5JEY2_9SPHI|nr:NADH-quinone oxidoreductase subunit N [Mucilaginibacter yixingensis]PTR00991.1 NADH dehydrogenase subunit N [Mucilaginibacter yixingensis]